jgi:hypothetical protein
MTGNDRSATGSLEGLGQAIRRSARATVFSPASRIPVRRPKALPSARPAPLRRAPVLATIRVRRRGLVRPADSGNVAIVFATACLRLRW